MVPTKLKLVQKEILGMRADEVIGPVQWLWIESEAHFSEYPSEAIPGGPLPKGISYGK